MEELLLAAPAVEATDASNFPTPYRRDPYIKELSYPKYQQC